MGCPKEAGGVSVCAIRICGEDPPDLRRSHPIRRHIDTGYFEQQQPTQSRVQLEGGQSAASLSQAVLYYKHYV